AALRRGASDYLEKPFSVDLLKERVQRLLQYRETLWKDRLVQRAMQPRTANSLVGESDAIRALHEQITLAARTPSNVLISGGGGGGEVAVGRRGARGGAPPRRGLRRDQLRRDSGGAAREPALRPRARRVHDRGAGQPGAVRGGEPGHPVPRRDRRDAAAAPG